MNGIRYGYFCGNISQKQQTEPAKRWIKTAGLYKMYTFKSHNCAPCTTLFVCMRNATGQNVECAQIYLPILCNRTIIHNEKRRNEQRKGGRG